MDTHPKDTALFKFKWREVLKAGDPYYNPGLSLKSTSWQNANPMHCSVDIKRRVFKRDALTGMQEITI